MSAVRWVLLLLLTLAPASTAPTYSESFQNLYEHLARTYPNFQLKRIDWPAVGAELLPRAGQVRSDAEFGLLCMELVARLKDSHAVLLAGSASIPEVPMPRWDAGLACLIDDRDRPVVYFVRRGSPAERAGISPGLAIVAVNGIPARQVLDQWMKLACRYHGYSSDRTCRYDAARWFLLQRHRGDLLKLDTEDPAGKARTFEISANAPPGYVPRLPVPIRNIADSANLSYTRLAGNVGYIYIRRIAEDLPQRLDRALGDLISAPRLIIDLRGNSGGGFDGARALRNFNPDDTEEPDRPRFKGRLAILIDERCISAGEGWLSWFVARKRARLFGSTTAGASSAKQTYTLSNGLYRVIIPTRTRRGFLDRPIEVRGIEPDVAIRCSAADLAAGKDTVLETARQYLLSPDPQP